jgi:uncharacterized DUF497 family protein
MSKCSPQFDSFEWDERKSEEAFAKTGIDFEDASAIFDNADGFTERQDRRRDYGEPRFIATGVVNELLVTVVWTPRGSTRRIITAWPATRREELRFRHGHRKKVGRGNPVDEEPNG